MEGVRENRCSHQSRRRNGLQGRHGADAALLQESHQPAPTPSALLRAVANQSRIPIVIYNWPQATGVDIPVEAVVALSEQSQMSSP